MKNTLLIRIPPLVSTCDDETAVQWATFSGGGELLGDVHVSEIGQIKEQWFTLQDEEEEADRSGERTIQDKLVLLLPGNLVISRRLELNSGQRKHIQSALPYLIEDDLAQDIESFHIAHYLHRKNSEVTLTAIPHASIQEILSVFERSGLSINNIYAECQLLSAAPETALLILDSAMVMMATPGSEALAIDYEAVPFALKQRATEIEEKAVLLQTEAAGRVSRVKLAYASGAMPTPDNKIDSVRQDLAQQGWMLEEEAFNGSIFEWFAQSYFEIRKSSRLVDLRQGSYRCPKKARRQIKQWRPLIALAACWLVLEIGLMIGKGIYFGQKADELWGQNAESYLSVFPQDRQVKDAKSRGLRTFDLQKWMQNRLKNMGQNPEGEPFLPLLQKNFSGRLYPRRGG